MVLIVIMIDSEIAPAYMERAVRDLDVVAISQDALVEHKSKRINARATLGDLIQLTCLADPDSLEVGGSRLSTFCAF
jgi:hypothetical protein